MISLHQCVAEKERLTESRQASNISSQARAASIQDNNLHLVGLGGPNSL